MEDSCPMWNFLFSFEGKGGSKKNLEWVGAPPTRENVATIALVSVLKKDCEFSYGMIGNFPMRFEIRTLDSVTET